MGDGGEPRDGGLARAADPTEAERRVLTVMFCDLVGSTALSERLDPEDLRAVVTTYQRAAVEIVERYEGHVAQYLGDGILVYYGYPEVHEDDAWRAVRSAMEIVSTIRFVDSPVAADVVGSLSVRVGIHTGPVVTGNIGAGKRTERLAMGMTPNIAARVQGVAEPDTVAISDQTRDLVKGRFRVESLGRRDLKGISRPIEVFRVTDEVRRGARVSATAVRPTALVGRTRELDTMMAVWEQAAHGRQELLLLEGEAGIGKSSLIDAFEEELVGRPHRLVRTRCLAVDRNSPLRPVIAVLRDLVGIGAGSDADPLDTLTAALDRWGEDPAGAVPLLAPLLDIPLAGEFEPLPLSPRIRRQRTLEATVRVFRAAARGNPHAVVFDDLHWADPSTLEFVTILVSNPRAVSLLVALAFRPGFTPAWSVDDATSLSLQRLDANGARRLMTLVAGARPLPEAVVSHVVDAAAGIPLFVEEVTRSLLDAGALEERNGAWVLAAPMETLDIPASLEAVLATRLERLGPAKRILQLASVLGREVDLDLLGAVASLHPEVLERELDRLVEGGWLRPADSGADRRFLFRQSLGQEVAYRSVLASRRRQYHRRVAAAIEEHFPRVVDARPETVARHWAHARTPDRAIPYYRRAGEQAGEAYANREAVALFTRAVDQVRDLLVRVDDPGGTWLRTFAALHEHRADVRKLTGALDDAGLDLRMALAQIVGLEPVWNARLYRKIGETMQAAHRTDEALTSLRIADATLGDPEDERPADWMEEWLQIQLGRMDVYYWQGSVEPLTAIAERLTDVIDRHGTPSQRAQFHTWLYALTLRRDRYVPSADTVSHARAVLAASEDAGDLVALAGSRFNLAFVLAFRGDLDEADRMFDASIELTRRTGDPFVETACLTYRGLVARKRNDVNATRTIATRSLALATEHGMQEYVGLSHANLAWVCGREDVFADAAQEADRALEAWTGLRTSFPFQWTATLPLLAAHRTDGTDIDRAVLIARTLDPSQQSLPETIAAPLQRAMDRLGNGPGEGVNADLTEALDAGRALGYT